MEKKKEYIKPELTVVSFKVEKGYAESITLTLNLWLASLSDPTNNHMESYEIGNGWMEGTDNFWQ